MALLLIAVPGADWAFTINAGLHGHSIFSAVGGLVVGYAAVTAVVYGILGSLARTVLGARPVIARIVSRLSGGAMVTIGVALLVEKLTSVS